MSRPRVRTSAAEAAALEEFVDWSAGVFGRTRLVWTSSATPLDLVNQRRVAMVTARHVLRSGKTATGRAFGRSTTTMTAAERAVEASDAMMRAVLVLASKWWKHKGSKGRK